MSKAEKKIAPLAKADFELLLKGITYPSESDEPVCYIELGASKTLSVSFLKKQLQIQNKPISKQKKDVFFNLVCIPQDWFGKIEKERMASFLKIREKMMPLRRTFFFRVGKIEIDVYVIGLDSDNSWKGIQTKIIET